MFRLYFIILGNQFYLVSWSKLRVHIVFKTHIFKFMFNILMVVSSMIAISNISDVFQWWYCIMKTSFTGKRGHYNYYGSETVVLFSKL